MNIQSPTGPEKARACLPHTPTQADHFRDLARRVRQLGRGNRHNPVETFILEKLDVASALDRLADQAEIGR
jgi:hypothetical protein